MNDNEQQNASGQESESGPVYKRSFVYYVTYILQTLLALRFAYWWFNPEGAPPGEVIAAMAPFFLVAALLVGWAMIYVVVIAHFAIDGIARLADRRYQGWRANRAGNS